MVKWVGVLPFCHQGWADECVATMCPEFKKNILFVDNTVNNIGIMASHNLGIEKMRKEDALFLIIISAAIRFGETGGMSFVDILNNNKDHYVIHSASSNVLSYNQKGSYDNRNHIGGWHLTSFRKDVFDNCGTFDNNFFPREADDIDLSLRIQKHYKGIYGWDTIAVWDNVKDMGSAHSINLAGVRASFAPRNEYFFRKWNRYIAEWDKPSFEYPFNDSTKPISWWPDPGHPYSIYNNEYKSGKWKVDE